jgi:dihydropteroate synthase/2-amino-4-hydroxy-6-hydroxymethyldihydropteridine diphosphokinase
MRRLRGGGGGSAHDDAARATSSSSSSERDGGDGDGDEDDRADGRRGSSSYPWRRAYLAVGSNLGDRHGNVANALVALTSRGDVRVLRTSYLRITSPMYVTDQPSFLNGAVEIETTLGPVELLRRLKSVEGMLGREAAGTRFGPRTIDMDILLYDGDDGDDGDDDGPMARPSSLVMRTEELEIPHPRMSEREFVLSPMRDLERSSSGKMDGGIIVHPVLNESMSGLLNSLVKRNGGRDVIAGGDGNDRANEGCDRAVRVLPLPRGRMLHLNETIIMGILNVTPDSFSDGGRYSDTVDEAAMRAMRLVEDGAGIIDVGGESTRPGATDVLVDEELDRAIPVIRRIREMSDVPISIDTRRSVVARAAIESGADVVNDVSGGTHDPHMLGCVASMGVPMIIMHMRGNPRTMQSLSNYDDIGGVVDGVAGELMRRSADAEVAGVPRWLQVIDPGIGFAKDFDGNLSILRNVDALRRSCGDLPILFGPSRKGFIGKITGETNPEERDYGTVAACLASIQYGDGGDTDACNILRVHNVRAVKQAVLVYDAIRNARRH